MKRWAVLLLVLVAGVTLCAPASPASAFTACPPGMVSYGVGVQYCIDPPTGLATAPNGIPAVKAQPLTVPASLEAAVQDTTASTAAKAGMVTQDAVLGAGKLAVAGKMVGTAGTIVGAGLLGFQVGQYAASLLCMAGASVECIPKASGYNPNRDVTLGADPGWQPQSTTIPQYVGPTGTQPARAITAGWGSPPGAPTGPPMPSPTPVYREQLSSISPTGSVNSGGWSIAVTGLNDAGAQVWGGVGGGCPNTCSVTASSFAVNIPAGVPATVTTLKFDFRNADNNSLGPIATVMYYLPGSANRPPAPVANPTRQLRQDTTCKNAAGATQIVSGALSATFTETDATPLPTVPPAGNCPTGFTVSQTKIVEISPTQPTQTIWGPYIVPQPVVDARLGTTFPQCVNSTCHTRLFKVNTDGSLADCFIAATDCSQWFADPNKAANYKCTYGPANTSADPVVALSECNYYSPSFDPQKQAQGVPYGDPATGAVPTSLVTPVVDPVTVTDGQSCFPGGFIGTLLAGPDQWVVRPLKCVFIPSDASLRGFTTTIKTAYDATAISEWATALGGIGGIAIPEGGCDGIHVTLPLMVTTANLHLFSTCDPPWSTVAGVVKAFLTVAIAWFCLAGVFRTVAAAFGLNIDWGRK